MTNLEIQNAYMGSDQVDKIYLGDEVVWPTSQPEPVYSAMPLTFEIVSGGDIKWVADKGVSFTPESKTIEYSINGGNHVAITSKTGSSAPSISVQAGDIVQFWGNNSTYASSNSKYSFFGGSTCGFKLKGNIMSLINSTGFTTATTLAGNYTFCNLFRQITGLTDASNLVLPATILSKGCYYDMFQGCTSLTIPPELPATTLASNCYMFMFANCTSLTQAPSILPATVLTDSCYRGMFAGCTSLTTAPELPATTLERYCYGNMFQDCTSLTTAPELPATTLASNCYALMFSGCSSLNYVKCLATDMAAADCLLNWLYGVSASGTFVKHPNATWSSGTGGIPNGWTVQNADI